MGGKAGAQLTARAKLDASSRRLLARAAALALGCPPASGSAARGAAQDLMQRGGAPGSQCVGGLSGALGLAPWPALTLFEATLPRSACCTELGGGGNLHKYFGPNLSSCGHSAVLWPGCTPEPEARHAHTLKRYSRSQLRISAKKVKRSKDGLIVENLQSCFI